MQTGLADMNGKQNVLLSTALTKEMVGIGEKLRRLRTARKVRQADAAVRAGIARSTASRIESGDPALAIGQLLRYLDAIAPGVSLLSLLSEDDPALLSLADREKTKRVRVLSQSEREELDF